MDMNNEKEVDQMIAERFSAFRADDEWQPNTARGLSMLREHRAGRDGRRRRWALVATGVAAACVPLLAFPMTRAFAERCVSACVQQIAVVREALPGSLAPVPANTNTFMKPGDRSVAPDFTLADASGQPVRLSDFRGKVVLVNFWATWCRPCKEEIPGFIEFQRSNAERGFSVVGVSMDEGGWSTVKPYIEKIGVNYPVVIGNDEVARLFGGLKSIPFTVVIDRAGKIAVIHSGLCSREEYERDIRTVLDEK
jgi:cytochrome c biogenesis protein CcmG/thiol:disulfide interchange protein DsbE